MDVVDAVGQFLQITFRPLLDVFRNFTKLTKKRIRDGDFASSAGRWLCPQLISQMDKITNLVREDRDDLLLEYRNAYLSESKFTDLKGVMLAQVALTGFILPHVENANCLALSLFALSVAAALLAVHLSNVSRKRLDACNQPGDLHLLFCTSLPTETSTPPAHAPHGDGSPGHAPSHSHGQRHRIPPPPPPPIITHLPALNGQPSVSKSAVLILALPSTLLQLSLSCIILAFGIYLRSVWLRGLNTTNGPPYSWKIFATYAITIFFIIGLYNIPNTLKEMEREVAIDRENALDFGDEEILTTAATVGQVNDNTMRSQRSIRRHSGRRESLAWTRHANGSRKDKEYRK